MQSTVYNAQPGATVFHEAVDVVGLIAFIFKDALIAALDREFDAEADDKAALTREARQQREAEAMGDLLSIEREEAALTWSAMEQGLPVEFLDARAAWSAASHRSARYRSTRNVAGPVVGLFQRRAAMTPIVQPGRLACLLPPGIARARDGQPSRATYHEPRCRACFGGALARRLAWPVLSGQSVH